MDCKILHITAHLGGGVGKALSGIASFEHKNFRGYSHEIILLEQPEKTNFLDICKQNGVEVKIFDKSFDIKKSIKRADIVQIEWWHHPVMAKFLANFSENVSNEPVRLVVWSHVSGGFYPYITPEFLRLPQKFMFTSECSFDNEFWTQEDRDFAKKNCASINSSGGFDGIKRQKLSNGGDFTVGYIGTQSFSKLNPDFIKFCAKISNIPNINFRMVGDKTNEENLLTEAKKYGIEDKFKFIDYVSDVGGEFAKMDVFGYLLNPTHFGTTENVLLEAMAAGLPVVCLDQCAEKYIVQHNKTGLLVKNINEYGESIRFLYENPKEGERLGNNAREFVLKNFSVEKTVNALHKVYDDVLRQDKRVFDFKSVFKDKPCDWFKACLPPSLREKFPLAISIDNLPPILKERSKSSLPHFCRIFPEDTTLQKWYKILKEQTT